MEQVMAQITVASGVFRFAEAAAAEAAGCVGGQVLTSDGRPLVFALTPHHEKNEKENSP